MIRGSPKKDSSPPSNSIPMWDSSDPTRAPPSLPIAPDSPNLMPAGTGPVSGSPFRTTSSSSASGFLGSAGKIRPYSSINEDRFVSILETTREIHSQNENIERLVSELALSKEAADENPSNTTENNLEFLDALKETNALLDDRTQQLGDRFEYIVSEIKAANNTAGINEKLDGLATQSQHLLTQIGKASNNSNEVITNAIDKLSHQSSDSHKELLSAISYEPLLEKTAILTKEQTELLLAKLQSFESTVRDLTASQDEIHALELKIKALTSDADHTRTENSRLATDLEQAHAQLTEQTTTLKEQLQDATDARLAAEKSLQEATAAKAQTETKLVALITQSQKHDETLSEIKQQTELKLSQASEAQSQAEQRLKETLVLQSTLESQIKNLVEKNKTLELAEKDYAHKLDLKEVELNTQKEFYELKLVSLETKLSELKGHHESEIKSLNDTIAREAAEAENKISALKSLHSKDLDGHQDSIETLKTVHSAEKEAYENKIKDLLAAHSKELQLQQDKYDTLASSHATEIQTFTEKISAHTKEIGLYQDKLDAMTETHAKEKQSLESKFSTHFDNLQAKQDKIDTLTDDHAIEKQKLQDKLEQLHSTHLKEKDELLAKIGDLSETQSKLQKSQEEKLEQLHSTHSKEKDELLSQVSELVEAQSKQQQAYEGKVESLVSVHADEKTGYEQRIDQLQSKLDKTLAKLENITTAHTSKLDTILSENSAKLLNAEKNISGLELKLQKVELEKIQVEAQLEAKQKEFDANIVSQRKELEVTLESQQKEFAAENKNLKLQLENAISNHEEKLSELTSKITERDTSIVDYKTKLDALQTELDTATNSVNDLTKKLVDTSSSFTDKIELLKSQLKEVEQSAADNKAALSRELAEAKEARTLLEFEHKEQTLKYESNARETTANIQKLETEFKLFDYFHRDLQGYEAQKTTVMAKITELREQEASVQSRITALEGTFAARIEGLQSLEARVEVFERRLAQTLLDKSKSIIGTTTLSILNTGNATKRLPDNGDSADSWNSNDSPADTKRGLRRNVSLFSKNMNISLDEKDEDGMATMTGVNIPGDIDFAEESELEGKENGLAGGAPNGALLNIKKKRAGNKRSVSLVVR